MTHASRYQTGTAALLAALALSTSQVCAQDLTRLNPTAAALAGPAGVAPRGMLLPHASGDLPTDTASNYGQGSDYNDVNGGTGFAAGFHHTGSGGTFTYTSNNNGGKTGPGIDSPPSPAQSFGLYSNGGDSSVTRSFPTALTPGETFRLDIDTGYLDGGAVQQYALTTDTGTALTFGFTGGQTYYRLNGQDTNIPYTDGGLTTLVTIDSATSYSVYAQSYAHGSYQGYTYTGNGTFTAPITGLKVSDSQNSGGDPAHDFYFNNITVSPSPEPGGPVSLLIGAALLGGVIAARRRRRSLPG